MCKEASTGLGSTNGSRPANGNRGVGNSSNTCPLKKANALLLVYVYLRDSTEAVQNAQVNLTGGKADAGPTDIYGTKSFSGLPAGEYRASIKVDHIPDLKGSRVEAVNDQLTLGAGQKKDMTFRVHPPVNDLTISVVRAVRSDDKDGPVITDQDFAIQLSGGSGGEALTARRGIVNTKNVALGRDYTATLTLTPEQQALYKPTGDGSARITIKQGGNTLKFPLLKSELKLTQVDDHFAPGKEDLEIKYDIQNLAKEDVRLRILDYAGVVLYERKLKDDEKQDGSGKTILWGKNDKVNNSGHALHGRLINPLFAPYKVVLFQSADLQGSKDFKVLYHSLKLELVPWDDLYKAASGRPTLDYPGDGDGMRSRFWLQYKLNKLGYWAGPVDGRDTEDLKKAIRRFCLAHPALSGWKNSTPFYTREENPLGKQMVFRPDVLTAITPQLTQALAAGDVEQKLGRPGLSEPGAISDTNKGSKLFVENHRFFVSEYTEFNSDNNPRTKFTCEEAWLSNPHVPIRARLTLKDKKDASTDSPAAVGQAPVLWSWSDLPESDLQSAGLAPALPKYKPDVPSRTADFVAQTQRDTKKGGFNGVPSDYGGGVKGDANDASAALYGCRWLNTAAEAKADKGVLTRTFDVDPDRTAIYGMPVIYLRASTIAGDNYQVKAQLYFDDETNKDALQRLNGSLAAQTGKIAVWRRVRLAAYVAWPARQGLNLDNELKKIKEEFSYSLVEIDTAKCKNLTAADVFDETSYKAVLESAKIGEASTDGLLDSIKNRGFSATDGLYKGEPEECELKFEDYVNKLMSGDATFRQTLAEAWRDHSSDPDVKAAGTHFATSPGTPLAGKTNKITAVQFEELLLPTPAKNEIEAYARGESLSATFTSGLWKYLGAIKDWLGKDREGLFPSLLVEQLQKIVTSSGFKPDVARLMRSWPLDLRKWVLRRRLGPFPDYIKMRLAEKTDLLVRKKLADAGDPCDGAMLLDYRVHKPARIRGEDFLTDGVAFGGLNGVALMDHGLKSTFYGLAVHELAHCMFLLHWKNAPTAVAANHDTADDNCMMSYPVFYKFDEVSEDDRKAFLTTKYQGSELSTFGHYCYDKFTPHFCGKCNLQLRGWSLQGAGIPAAAAIPNQPRPTQPITVRLVQDEVTWDDHAKRWNVVSYASKQVTSVGISFYPPNKAGSQNAAWQKFGLSGFSDNFPTGFGDHAGAALDPGAFRVEVQDPNLDSKILYVTLEALRPQYDANGKVTGWTEFAGEERKRRSLVNVECVPTSGDPHIYRSRYLRLVVDEFDHQALASTKQGLLVSDMVSWDSSDDDDRVEILDQKIRVYYDPTP